MRKAMNSVQYLTDEGAKKLEKRLGYLKTERLRQLIEQIHEIAQEGDSFDESPEYAAVKAEQDFIESEIERLERLLQTARILEQARNCDEVSLGSRVTISEKGSQQQESYQLLSSAEANPREGSISIESPLGQALLGVRVGDEIKVEAPDGELIFIVRAIQ